MISAGGLLGLSNKQHPLALSLPANWTAPKFIDLRGYCTPIENQGDTPRCAAYSASTLIEARNWKRDHFYSPIDPGGIYTEAKRIDGNNSPGTYLTSVVEAAFNLKLIETPVVWSLNSLEEVQFAMHECGIVLLGFDCTEGWSQVNTKTGWIGGSTRSLGGHAVTGCWYEQGRGIGWANSWGTQWGNGGFGRMTEDQFKQTFIGGLALKGV